VIYNSPRIRQRQRAPSRKRLLPLIIQQMRNARFGINSNYLYATTASGEIDFY
jgi:hypothetical protein